MLGCVGVLGEVPHSLSGIGGGWSRSVAGRAGGAGYRRVLGAGEGRRWVHEAEEGVSGVSLHLSQTTQLCLNTATKHLLCQKCILRPW